MAILTAGRARRASPKASQGLHRPGRDHCGSMSSSVFSPKAAAATAGPVSDRMMTGNRQVLITNADPEGRSESRKTPARAAPWSPHRRQRSCGSRRWLLHPGSRRSLVTRTTPSIPRYKTSRREHGGLVVAGGGEAVGRSRGRSCAWHSAAAVVCAARLAEQRRRTGLMLRVGSVDGVESDAVLGQSG